MPSNQDNDPWGIPPETAAEMNAAAKKAKVEREAREKAIVAADRTRAANRDKPKPDDGSDLPMSAPDGKTPFEVEVRRSIDRVFATRPAAPGQVTSMVKPVVEDAEEAVKMWKLFNELKSRLLTDDDYYSPVPNKKVPKRTGWRKLALFFGLSTDIVEERRWQRGNVFGYDFLAVAIAPNGQFTLASGTYDSAEMEKQNLKSKSKGGKGLDITEHNVRSKAETRSKNRAISDLIGGGELSAEEIEEE